MFSKNYHVVDTSKHSREEFRVVLTFFIVILVSARNICVQYIEWLYFQKHSMLAIALLPCR